VEEEAAEVKRRRPVGLLALNLAGLLLVAFLLFWLQRRPIAEDYIDRALAAKGVHASYELKRIGFGTQRLENLVLGDPVRPDLTARWVEVHLRWGLSRPRIVLIKARGVRLRGRLVDGKLKLGQLDRLMPPPSGLPFRLPDQAIDVADASLRLETPGGRVGIALEGRGNLADGFRGRLAASSRSLALGSCRLTALSARWSVRVDDLKPRLEGPARAARLGCGSAFELVGPQVLTKVRLTPGLDGWNGASDLRVAAMRFGANRLASLTGRLEHDGTALATRGGVRLSTPGASIGPIRAGVTSIGGDYALNLQEGRLAFVADATGDRIAVESGALKGPVSALRSAGGTPLEPIGEAIATALLRGTRDISANGSLRLAYGAGVGAVRFERLEATSTSGARLSVRGGNGLTHYWNRRLTRLDGILTLAGGGLPDLRLSLEQSRPGAPIRGVGRMAPYAAGGARLALADLRFAAAPNGMTSIETLARIDGPLPDGAVRGLVLPIAGRLFGNGGLAFGERCIQTRFDALKTGSLRLGATRLPLCPQGRALLWRIGSGPLQGGAEIRSPRFAGSLGQSPLTIVADRLALRLGQPGFTGSNVAVRLGGPEVVNRLDVATFDGRLVKGGIDGSFAGAKAKLASVPLELDEGSGRWQLRGANLALGGTIRVSDEIEPARFYPLVSKDFRLTLSENRIEAGGPLTDPETGTHIADIRIAHALGSGAGQARLDVPGIVFGPDYQPEQLTRLTTGVIALVNGTLKGEGLIEWDSQGSRSRGAFSTEDMDLAASFGPVEDLTTRVEFSDLLGLATAPGQVAEIGLIRTGIDVLDGRIRYQLLPGLQVRVESGRWPFAGGELILEETVLDFAKPSAKHLTFKVVGLDAARFVQQMEFSNISATGTFDGIIPMIFDERGGRIEGGHLIARAEGGTLSYIGELTDKQLGVYGKLAFDALKALRYNKLEISLDGSLTGEFVAGIELDGVARDPALTQLPGGGISGLVARRALGQLARIPFEFNISVKGPFRTLLATTRSLENPTDLIQSVLPEMLRDRPPIPVQPDESETKQ
jgi:translocation and assembly module TamB